eukprot:CAMPEP_0197503678 /NCGR_PEP_ID=MMETSP1312-20131121/2845_1 /TAXON_ID=464262 /ORGANISM="Genus nov. species nov., Strain RCC2335" /LENGTH=38 /DNA_ID= /DNA_START= /DNA_END= /DNA_ORIENTATION=
MSPPPPEEGVFAGLGGHAEACARASPSGVWETVCVVGW